MLTAIIVSGCSRNPYISEEIASITRQHERVAILPVHVSITGNLPENVTEEQLNELYETESKMFQNALLSGILRRTKGGKTPYWVQFLSNDETNTLLEKKQINLHEINEYSPTELAEILNVDAVVKADVIKERFMSETLSAVIAVGEDVIEEITDVWLPIPSKAKRTYEVYMQLELVDKSSGANLYHRSIRYSIDYRSSVTDAVYIISGRIGKYFPYKAHKLRKGR